MNLATCPSRTHSLLESLNMEWSTYLIPSLPLRAFIRRALLLQSVKIALGIDSPETPSARRPRHPIIDSNTGAPLLMKPRL